MKRILSIFTLAVMMLLGLALHATNGNAQTITCTDVTTEGAYPFGDYTKYCTNSKTNTPTSGDGALMAAGLNNTYTGQGTQFAAWMASVHKTNAAAGVFYLFNSPADFEAWAPTHMNGVSYPKSIDATDFGVSVSIAGVNQAPIYTLVFLNRGDGFENDILAKTSGHEAGHYLDWLYASLTGKSQVPNGPNIISNSADFASELSYDWELFDDNPTCYNTVSGGDGVFTSFADYLGQLPVMTGNYICGTPSGYGHALGSDYSKYTSNKEVLEAAWPYIYDPGSNTDNTTQPNRELFAEAYTTGSLSYSDAVYFPSEADVYLGNDSDGGATGGGFPCTRAFISNLIANDKVPSKSNPPTNWPSGTLPNGTKWSCPLF